MQQQYVVLGAFLHIPNDLGIQRLTRTQIAWSRVLSIWVVVEREAPTWLALFRDNCGPEPG